MLHMWANLFPCDFNDQERLNVSRLSKQPTGRHFSNPDHKHPIFHCDSDTSVENVLFAKPPETVVDFQIFLGCPLAGKLLKESCRCKTC